MTVGTVLVLLVITTVAFGLALRRGHLRDAASALRLLAVALAAVAAVGLFGPVWLDSGGFAVWALGVPVLVTLVPLSTARFGFGAAVTGLVAGFLLVWSLLLALGIGLFLLPAALAEAAAAVTQRRPRTTAPDLTGTTPGG
jgi:hypothetical protein